MSTVILLTLSLALLWSTTGRWEWVGPGDDESTKLEQMNQREAAFDAVVVNVSIQFISGDSIIPADLLGLIESKHWINISSLILRIVAQEGSQCQKLTTYLHFYFLWQILYVGYIENLVVKYLSFTFTSQLGQYIWLAFHFPDSLMIWWGSLLMSYCWIIFSFVIVIRPNLASAQADSVLKYSSKISS